MLTDAPHILDARGPFGRERACCANCTAPVDADRAATADDTEARWLGIAEGAFLCDGCRVDCRADLGRVLARVPARVEISQFATVSAWRGRLVLGGREVATAAWPTRSGVEHALSVAAVRLGLEIAEVAS